MLEEMTAGRGWGAHGNVASTKHNDAGMALAEIAQTNDRPGSVTKTHSRNIFLCDTNNLSTQAAVLVPG